MSGDWGEGGGPLEAAIFEGKREVHHVSWPFARVRARAWWLLHGGWLR